MDATKEPMNATEAKFHRRCAAKLRYMSLDRLDLGAAAKVRHVGRYLRGRPVCVIQYFWQSPPGAVVVRTDSGWASTSSTSQVGFKRVLPCHLAKPSLEHKLLELLSDQSLQRQCFWIWFLFHRHRLRDSSAARGIMHRIGLERMKHLEVRHWCVQKLVAKRHLKRATGASSSRC